MTSRFVVDAVEQAIWTRAREGRALAKSVIGLSKPELIKPTRPLVP